MKEMQPIHHKIAVVSMLVLASAPGSALAQEGSRILRVQISERYGEYIGNAAGRAVYLFTADRQGRADQEPVSNCYDACAQAWPPVTVADRPRASAVLHEELLSTMQRRDGSTQATYNGWPLYYYVEDRGRGEVTGQDVRGFGGEWYLVAPDGTKVQAEEAGDG